MIKGKRGEKQNKTKAKTKPKPKCENVKFLVLINPHNRLLIESSAHILQSTFYTPHSTFPVHSSLSCSWLGRAVLPHFFTLYRSLYLPLWWACEQHLVHFSMRYSSRTDFNLSLSLSSCLSLQIRRRTALCCRKLIPSWDCSWDRHRDLERELGQRCC